jgi:hypothetical protein
MRFVSLDSDEPNQSAAADSEPAYYLGFTGLEPFNPQPRALPLAAAELELVKPCRSES